MNKIFLSPPYMGGAEKKYVEEAFATNWIAPLGPNVTAFEQEMGAYLHTPYPLAVVSGTAAIHLCLKYLGVRQDDLVFCSSFTFSGSCNAICYEKATPVFIDSEPESYNMSPVALRKALEWAKSIGKLPRAVIIVDLYGQSADWDALLPICREYGVPVLEDAAEALGTKYHGEYCGNFGDLEYRDYLITTPGGLKIMFWGSNATLEQLGIIRELKPDIAIMQFTKQTPEDLAAMAEAGSVKVLIPHHMDLAMSEDVYLPRIEEMERAVHARVPGCTVITPERLRWYHMGLSVWA